MKIKIGENIYDPEREIIAICFDNDRERLKISKQIEKNFRLKPGKRVFTIGPDGIKLSTIQEFIKPLLK